MDRGRFFIKVSHRVAKIRKERGYTQARLAASSGLAEKHIAAIEQGHTKPTLNTLFAICEGLGIGLEEFFTGM